MSEDRTTVLFERDDVLRRLSAINLDPNIKSGLFEALAAQLDGKKLDGDGVAVQLQLAIVDYVEKAVPPQMAPESSLTLHMLLRRFMRELIDDEAVLDAALDRIRRSERSARSGL